MREPQKFKPFRSSADSARNIGSVGSTNQNVDCDRAAMASLSPVSRQSHMKASSETSGSERMSAPNAGLRFATSEAAAMIAPEMSALVIA